MFKAFVDDQFIRNFETLTLLHPYKSLQNKIADTFAPYCCIAELYSKATARNVYNVTHQYLEEHPELSEQNVALLRNAIELWRTAKQASEAVSPVLYHYSLHCFVSFFNYTFFRWEPEHAKGHGLHVSKWSDNVLDIEIQVSKEGIFPRLIDAWTLLGAYLVISPILPIFQGEKIVFVPNDQFLLSGSRSLSLQQLLSFDPSDFERNIISNIGHERINDHPPVNSISTLNRDFKNYLLIFLASSLARYRPYIWDSVLAGETQEQSDLYTASTGALVGVVHHFLYNVSGLFQEIRNGEFEFRHSP